MVENSDVGRLLRGMLRCGRVLQVFRGMRPQHEWLSGYIDMLERLDNLEPRMFDAVANAFGTLLLMHHNSEHDWLRKKSRDARRKQKKVVKTRKRKSKRKSSDDDDDGDDNDDAAKEIESNDAGSGDDEDAHGITAAEQDAIDEEIDGNAETPLINCDSASAVPVEVLLDDYEKFVPWLEPLLFECRANAPRPHAALHYALLIVLHTCEPVAQTMRLVDKCRKRLAALRTTRGAELGCASECATRVLLIGWGATYATAKSRGYRALKKQLGEFNRTSDDGVTCEFFSIDELQHDVTRGWTEQFAVLSEATTSADEKKWLRTVKTHEMRRLRVSDPQAALRDFAVGQRIRITRWHLHSGGHTLEYAQVVEG